MLSFMVAVVFCVFASGTLAAGAEAVDHVSLHHFANYSFQISVFVAFVFHVTLDC